MKNIFLLILLIFVQNKLKSQIDTIFFDENQKIVKLNEEYKYFRIFI